ncbi:threonine--tRNA ligase [Rickettsiales bacterium]|nr:threonine--tRNA ligase [Rickettsiales bacterium]
MNTDNEIKITFPDGKVQNYKKGITGIEIAIGISKSLSKTAVAISINGIQKDLADNIYLDAKISIITIKSDEGIQIMRHTLTAQVLARAVKNLFPKAKLAIGPTIENGFYYDILFEKKISTDDFPIIEKEMRRIISNGSEIKKSLKTKKDSIKLFQERDELYKVDIINRSDQEENFQIYQQGESEFIDLCHGPHLPNLKFIGAFKLTKLAGAYWKGDSKNEMLQRIYGTAWLNDKDLKTYLDMLEEAEKRDHRKIGKELDLFHMQEHAPGSVFWHPKGWVLYRTIMEYMRLKLNSAGYQEVNTPQLVDSSLWKDSGHWDKFREHMFTSRSEEKILAIKPMNCPCHVQIFRQGIKSYKELPIRMAEFGCCHRNEPSGALHGLMRVRAFTQDDAHIFCTEDQIVSETERFCKLLMEVYKDFGFEDVVIKFSDRPENRAGSDVVWDQAEKSLIDAVEAAGYKYELNPGEGAFYGPKLEFILRDAIGRDWQCGTLQVDFVLPDRLDANYIGEDGMKHRPVMLHRAVLGSFERFIGIILENYSGKLPYWLNPIHVAIVNLNENCLEYAKKLQEKLDKISVRTIIDDRNEKINYKIREHAIQKVPFTAVIGNREIDTDTITLRTLGSANQETIGIKKFIEKIKNSCSMPETVSN